MKVLVCGSRYWDDLPMIKARLREIPAYPVASLIHGGCKGADLQAAEAARILGFKSIQMFPANWIRDGPAAGPIRNRLMLDENPDIVLAFHDDYENSKGTRDLVEEARRRHVYKIEIIAHKAPPVSSVNG